MQSPGERQNMKVGCNRYSPKSMMNFYLVIHSDLKIDRKLQKATEAIFYCAVSWLVKKIDQSG